MKEERDDSLAFEGVFQNVTPDKRGLWGGGREEGGGRKWYHKKITQTEPESFSPPPQAINNDPSLATPITECIEVKPRECRLFIFYSKTNKT